MLVFGNSNLVDLDGNIPLGSPGTLFKMPFWKRIAAFASISEGTAMTPGRIQATSEYATVKRAGVAFEVYDTAELVSKADPMSEISSQLGRRAAEWLDADLVVEANKSPNTFTVTRNAGVMDNKDIITALSTTLGDNFARVQAGGAIIVHSKVFADLLKTDAIQNQYQSGMNVIQTGQIPTLNGMPVIVSDLVTTATVSSVLHYKSYIVAPKALALFYQRQVLVEFDRDILLQADVVAATVHYAPHLYGFDDNGATVVAEQNKSIGVVILDSV